jgi:hypothetical protein
MLRQQCVRKKQRDTGAIGGDARARHARAGRRLKTYLQQLLEVSAH